MSEYNIQMNKYNALNAEYDQLYPATKIENVDGLDTALQNKANTADLQSHTANKSNPHGVTAEQVGAMSMTLLWENASKTSAFAPQTISLDLSGYDAICVELGAGTDWGLSADVGVPSAFMPIGKYVYCSAIFVNWLVTREVGAYTNGVTFKEARICAGSFTKETDNTFLIPHKIYGVKL